MKRLRIAAMLLCIPLLFALRPAYSHAAENATLVVEEASGRRGATVTVDVTLTAVNGAAAGGFNVVYNRSALQLVSAETGEALAGVSALVNEQYAADAVRVTFAGAEELSKAGVVLRLQFRISGSAAIGAHAVTIERAKLMDVNSQVIPCAAQDGSVTVQAVSMALSSVECAAGQDAALEVSLVGDLLPCGGAFTLSYDEEQLTMASVKAEAALGGTGITLLSNVDTEAGIIRITWAASKPIGEMGKLCTVAFSSSNQAEGSSEVLFSNVSFYDENGAPAESFACADGLITFTEAFTSSPMLYMVGGRLDPDGTSTIRVIMDAPNLVCGGSFVLSYDAAICTPIAMTASTETLITNPVALSDADGQIAVAWMHTYPPAEREVVVELRFSVRGNTASDLRLFNVELSNKEGESVLADVYSGKVGISSALQQPVIISASSPTHISGWLFDASCCTDKPVSAVRVILAYYHDGRMIDVMLPAEQIAFGQDGMAAFDIAASKNNDADCVKVFFVDSEGHFAPMCECIALTINQ